ncbi:phenylacetate--CoA ligase [Anoxybacillus gonensis]|uniref:AMP-binding protein n=1 Tax=Anoxybacillus gonensis TaxID=198467 RepID=A0AAW7TFX2_9BACL|nr:AMP-binding protein [Anoxybacillus gonensis]AKS39242.1 phenylacetate--CoA ligase [Anoxybacillus gonensis]KGP61087.1 phenylacetate--CoA ligase [Anoxybacillus gonensis]MCX8045608.1 AMP-binding protein [Anoxybacillus gonensis]MDO0877009.1 AMP-binding protein [Anoxybacillus gonensis]
MERWKSFLIEAYEQSLALRERLDAANMSPYELETIEQLNGIPVLKKEQLPLLQKHQLPFGNMITTRSNELARIFMSPGPIYDPQGKEEDDWGFAEALQAAGFTSDDIVQNTFSYHLSPAGFMFDSALRRIGATVVPAGPGNRELQVQLMNDLQVTGYVGTPSFLHLLLQYADEKGIHVTVKKAFFTAEKLTENMRDQFEQRGIHVFEGYGTADCGCIAFEDRQGPGLKISSRAIVQLCDPISGVPLDEEGEIVVTIFDRTYPLVRFGTGDVSRWVDGYKGERIVGVLGRVGTSVKVKGMFVHEQQLKKVMADVGCPLFQAVVTNEGGHDQLTIYIEKELDEEAKQKIKNVIRITPTFVSVDRVNGGERCLIDRRKW